MLFALYSPNGTYDTTFLANYAYINLNDPIDARDGVGLVQVFGAGQYAMRLLGEAGSLAKLGITFREIVNAVQAQNTVNPAGQVGGEPIRQGRSSPTRCARKAASRRRGLRRHRRPRRIPTARIVRVRDVARIELGAQNYNIDDARSTASRPPSSAIYQLPGPTRSKPPTACES